MLPSQAARVVPSSAAGELSPRRSTRCPTMWVCSLPCKSLCLARDRSSADPRGLTLSLATTPPVCLDLVQMLLEMLTWSLCIPEWQKLSWPVPRQNAHDISFLFPWNAKSSALSGCDVQLRVQTWRQRPSPCTRHSS